MLVKFTNGLAGKFQSDRKMEIAKQVWDGNLFNQGSIDNW